jgi:hypothetical protein
LAHERRGSAPASCTGPSPTCATGKGSRQNEKHGGVHKDSAVSRSMRRRCHLAEAPL